MAANGRRGRIALVLVATLGPAMLLTACAKSQPSVEQLRKIAQAVPLPPGLTFVSDTNRLQRPGDFGTQSQNTITLTYRMATPVDCAQLTASWRTALRQAHRKFQQDVAAAGELYLTSGDVHVTLITGLPGRSCEGASMYLAVPN